MDKQDKTPQPRKRKGTQMTVSNPSEAAPGVKKDTVAELPSGNTRKDF